MPARIGIDTGGTFTDVVRWSPRGLQVHKLPSTPADPAQAVLQGLAAVRRTAAEEVLVVHGTTVGLNAVLTGQTCRTAFVTNHGFEDLIEIGRQERSELYALEPSRPELPVPRALRLGVDCRRGPGGVLLRPLTAAAIARTVRQLRRLRPQAVAIGLLHSPADPRDERRLAGAVRAALPGVVVTCSADLLPAYGEFERFSAAILNAAIAPLVSAYAARLVAGIGNGRLRLLRSSLGLLTETEARDFPARAMFSGPAGGVLATAAVAKACGFATAAALDMGGTSTDVCLVQKGERTDQGRINGLPLPLPSVAVHTVGCGGGSIAFCDRGGALRVGPHSAGADPGPACYGRSDQPTVTDAHMVLGHLDAHTLLGGALPVDAEASVRALERLARKLGLSLRRTAAGILEVADIQMTRALMVITVERAVDPAHVPLVAYGGAGGLHAAALATRLGMPSVLVPVHPGAFSAIGLCLAGESAERVQAMPAALSPATERRLAAAARRLRNQVARELDAKVRTRCDSWAVLRYQGQGGGLPLRLQQSGHLRDRFVRAHRERFGFAAMDTPIEVTGLLARAELPGPALPRFTPAAGKAAAPRHRRPPGGGPAIPIYRREELVAGQAVRGPCIIEELTAATRLLPGWLAQETGSGLRLVPP